MKRRSALEEVWQREIDGVAKKYVRNLAVVGMEDYAALDALSNGASPEAVREALEKARKLFGGAS